MDNGENSYRRYLDGDKSAFDEILICYRDSLTLFINRYVHDISAAEDICIDTFMELIVHRHRYNFRTTLKTYLFMIGRCKALDYIKHKNRLTFVEMSDVQIAETKELEDSVIEGEQKRVLNRAIEKLPDEMRIAVHLVYFEGLSYKDAAKVMKKTNKQIDNLLYRAKSALRQSIGKDGELFL